MRQHVVASAERNVHLRVRTSAVPLVPPPLSHSPEAPFTKISPDHSGAISSSFTVRSVTSGVGETSS